MLGNFIAVFNLLALRTRHTLFGALVLDVLLELLQSELLGAGASVWTKLELGFTALL